MTIKDVSDNPTSPSSSVPSEPTRHDSTAYQFYRSIGSPQFVMAPMVDGSELPYRMLCRRYGTQLAYSPMLKASYIVHEQETYVPEHFTTCATDRPLFVQLCGNNAEELVAAARLLQPFADAIDLNLGCPQTVARREHFGAFLMDDLPLVCELVRSLAQEISIPITCKMRRFPDVHHTIGFATALVESGCQLLAVHGRMRDQKNESCSRAEWDVIKLVKDSVPVPVFANGNILVYEDVASALSYTGCDGVMVAESLLWDPRFFSNPACPLLTGRIWDLRPPADRLALDLTAEYLDLCHLYPTRHDILKRHMWWLLHHSLTTWPRMTDVLRYEGLEDQVQYWQRVEDMVCQRRSELAVGPNICDGGGISPEAATQVDDNELNDGHNERLVSEIRVLHPMQRPLYPHKETEGYRINEYKREVRAECKKHMDQLDQEDFDGLGLFEDVEE